MCKMSEVFGYMQKQGCIFNLSKKFESSSKSDAVSKKWIYMDSWINKGIQLHLIKTYSEVSIISTVLL